MANYDNNVTSSILNLEIKSRVFRVDFQRPPSTGNNTGLYANCFLQQSSIDATLDSPTSESILSSTQWLITITRDQILSLPNAGSFLNGLVNLITGLKVEYDTNGSLATGSISQLS